MLNRKTNLVEDMIICNDPLGTSKQQMLTVVIPYPIPYLFIIPQFNLHDNRNSLRMQKRFLETFQLFKLFTGGKSITRKLLKWRTPKNSLWKRKKNETKGNLQIHTPMRIKRKNSTLLNVQIHTRKNVNSGLLNKKKQQHPLYALSPSLNPILSFERKLREQQQRSLN